MAQRINDIIKKATLRVATARICVAGHLNAELEDLEAQLQAVSSDWVPDSLASTDPKVEVARKIQALQEEMRGSEVVFRFQALPELEWSDLLAKHPAREGQAELFNPQTLPPVLIPMCCVDPVMSAEQYARLVTKLNASQRNSLFNAAWDANSTATSVPFSLSASAILAASTGAK